MKENTTLKDFLQQKHAGYFCLSSNCNSEEDLKKEIREAYERFCKDPPNYHKTFPQQLKEIIGVQDFQKSKDNKQKFREFLDETGLDDKLLSDCRKNLCHKPELSTLVSIIIGLKLNKTQRDNILKSSGRALEPIDNLNRAYLFLLNIGEENFNIILSKKLNKARRIQAGNELLRMIGIEEKDLLGRSPHI